MTRRFTQSFIVALICVIASLWTSHAHAHGVTLKVHHALPANSAFHTQVLLPWMAKLESESHGLLRFQVFPAMQLGGDPSQLYDQVKEQSVDIVWTATGHSRFPAFAVFDLPFMTNSAQGSSRALWEYVQANDLTRSEFAGVRLLAVHVAPAKPSDTATPPRGEQFILAMNAATYKSLSDELKKVIIANSGAETSAWVAKLLDDTKANAAKPTQWQQRAQSAIEDRIKELDQRGLNGKELLDSASALLGEYDPAK